MRPVRLPAGVCTEGTESGADAKVGRVAADLIARARAGDGEAFRELTERYRRELQVHCYRMLGSVQDSEDAVQDTLLAAWQGLGGFEERSSLRTWLYKIATNRCLDLLRAAERRPAREWDVPGVVPPEPTRLGEVTWLEPFPDSLLEGIAGTQPSPEARYDQAESISLAFVTALQILPPRQVAVLILRDVLDSTPPGWAACWTRPSNRSPARSNGHAPACNASALQPEPGNRRRLRLRRRGRDHGEIHRRVAGRGRRRAGGSADRRRLHLDAADSLRIHGPGPGGQLLRQPVPRGPQVRPRTDACQRPARVRRLLRASGTRRGTRLYVLTLTGDRIRAMTASMPACSVVRATAIAAG